VTSLVQQLVLDGNDILSTQCHNIIYIMGCILTTFSFSRGLSSQNQGNFELQGDFKVRDGVKLKWILVWCN